MFGGKKDPERLGRQDGAAHGEWLEIDLYSKGCDVTCSTFVITSIVLNFLHLGDAASTNRDTELKERLRLRGPTWFGI